MSTKSCTVNNYYSCDDGVGGGDGSGCADGGGGGNDGDDDSDVDGVSGGVDACVG